MLARVANVPHCCAMAAPSLQRSREHLRRRVCLCDPRMQPYTAHTHTNTHTHTHNTHTRTCEQVSKHRSSSRHGGGLDTNLVTLGRHSRMHAQLEG